MLQIITTTRLQLMPSSLELKKATISDKTKVAELLGVDVPQHWPGSGYASALPFFVTTPPGMNPSGFSGNQNLLKAPSEP